MITIRLKRSRVCGVEMQRIFANDEQTALVLYPYRNKYQRGACAVSVECKELQNASGYRPAGVNLPIVEALNRTYALDAIARIVAEVTGIPTRVEGSNHALLRGGRDEYDSDNDQ
jgi:hypothetical protein